MRTMLTLLLLLAMTLCAAEQVIPELRTNDGRLFKQVKVTKMDAAEVRIMHAEGFATVRLSDLTPEGLALFGGKIDKHAETMADAERQLARARGYVPPAVPSTSVPTTVSEPTAATSAANAPISAEENAQRAWQWYQWCQANPDGGGQMSQQQRDELMARAAQTVQAWQAAQQQPRTSGSLADRGTRQVGRSYHDPERVAERLSRLQWQQANIQPGYWHSRIMQVCHNNVNCNSGNNIEEENLTPGTGGKPLCQECARLSQGGQVAGQPTGAAMVQAAVWYSIKAPVCHNNRNCNTGNNIEAENRQAGAGGRPLCIECQKLNQSGR